MADTPPQTGTRSVSSQSTRRSSSAQIQNQLADHRERDRRRAVALQRQAALQRARLKAQRRVAKASNPRGMRSPPNPRARRPPSAPVARRSLPRRSEMRESLTPSGLVAMPTSKGEILRRAKKQDRATKKEIREAKEYDEMKWRPISWSEEMKEVARKDKDNPLAGQYLWMDDENALGSAAWIEKGINNALKIDPKKKFEWDRWMKRSLPDKVGELGWEFVKGAANTIPSVMRVMSSGAYSASKLVSAPPKLIAPTLTEATGKMVTTGIKEALENPAGFAGGMVGITGVAGGLAKAAKVGVRGARKAGKLRGKGKKEPSVLNVLKEEKGGTHPTVKVETQKSPKTSASSKRVEGKRETQPSARIRIAREEKGGIGRKISEKGEKNKQMKNDRSEGRKKREEERKKREEEMRKREEEKRRKQEEERRKREEEKRRKQEEDRRKREEERRKKREEEKRKKREEEKRKQEKRRKKREEIRKKQKKEKLKKERGRKPKKARKPHRRLKKIVKRAKFPPNGASSARNPRGKTAGRSAKSYRRKEIINQLPWL